jgi:hypothetical protein
MDVVGSDVLGRWVEIAVPRDIVHPVDRGECWREGGAKL